jgi:hypothetical protein
METTKGYLGLIAAVIRSGLNDENREYPLTSDGRYWCSLGNIDPEYVIKRADRSVPEPSVAESQVQMANIQD